MVNVTSAPSVTGASSATPSASTLPDTLVGFQHNTTQYTYASPASVTNDVNGGFPRFVGNVRLAITLAGGNATWTGLGAGVDGQHVVLWNTDTVNTLTLSVANTGSLAPNRFQGTTSNYALAPGLACLLVYYAGLVNAWVVVEIGSAGGGGGSTNLAISATVTAASTDNYNPGSGFPTSIGRLYINPSTNDITFTGLLAGSDGQQVIICNTGSTYTITLANQSGSSSAANRFLGQGDAAIPAGGQEFAIYSSTLTAWSIG